ncbi:unnamed protein product, partial [Ectocarpus sp. 12 AP-2014]
PGDGSRTSRKDYARGDKPKWRNGSGRGDVGGSEAKKPESDAGSESSVMAGTQGAEGLVVPSASEEPLPKVEKATVAADGTAAVDEAVAFPGEERTVGQGETEAAGVSLIGGAVDVSGLGGLGDGGTLSVDRSSSEGSSSSTADGARGESSVDELRSGSGAPGAGDKGQAGAVVAQDSPSEDSDDLMAGDEANVEVGSSSEQLPGSPWDTAKEARAEERVVESSSEREEASGGDIMSTASGAGVETTLLQPADARAKLTADDTNGEE